LSQVGYRQFCTHHTPTRFCFGHGLTYSCFEYSQLSLSAHRMPSTESLQVSVQLTNSGRISAREIVQLYVRDRDCSVHRPDRELRAFGKTKLLEPGATTTLQFTLTPRAFAFYDIRRSDWYVELGGL
jgi:beta-glucosidase